MLEAMSCGSLIIGSDTDPVKEVIKNGENGILVPFSDPKELAKQLIQAVKNRDLYTQIKKMMYKDT